MPDFPAPPGGGATAAQVWAYATRELSGLTGTPRTDLLGEDATFEAGVGARKAKIDNVDQAISAVKTDILVDPVTDKIDGSQIDASIAGRAPANEYDTELDVAISTRATQAQILSDATPFLGANLDAAISSRSSHAAAAIWAEAARTLTGLTGTPRTDLLGEDASFEAATGRPAKIPRLDNIPAYETPVEATITLTGPATEDVLVEKLDNKIGLLDGYADLTPMGASDTVVIRQYMQVKAAGTYVKYAEETYSAAQTIPLLHIITKTAKDKIKVTAERTAGTVASLDVQFYRRLQA
ncbi:MAG: hypothetical protein KKD44_26020 [Proteobacteria bacterium]|nr:hypothetical protein [Pseudomonadota bacterium]